MRKILFILAVFTLSVSKSQVTTYVMDYNGSGNDVSIGTNVGNGVRSIEFWFKPTLTINSSASMPGYSMIVRDDVNQTYEYGVYIKGSDWNGFGNVGHLAFFVRYSGVLHEIVSNASSWTAGTWYHVAGVLDPSAGMLLYINGVLQSNTDASATSPVQTDTFDPTYLGAWGNLGIRYFDGRMDELRLWTRAISQNEIQTKMCQNLIPANETGLKAYWEFNEGSGAQILDATVNGYNGTVYGTTWVMDSYCSQQCVPPTVNINGVTNLCSGSGTILTASGTATSFTWSANAGSVHTSTVSLSPTSTTTYTLLSADSACSIATTITVSVTATPTLTVSGNTNVCSGNGTTLTGLGATSYTWNTGSISVSSQSINVNPNTSGTFTLTGTNGNCVSTKTVAITVTPTPTLAISGSTSICSGNSTVLTGAGATTYSWSSNAGSATTSSVSVNPPSTTTYTLYGANGNCIVLQPITVFVTATPTVNISGPAIICSGTPTTLTGSGAGTYTWSPNAGSVHTSTANVSPQTTTTYTLSGSNGSCNSSSVITLTVLPSPVITVHSETLCVGNTATITATGANSYTWNPQPQFSNSNSSIVLDNPGQTTTYTVNGTGSNGCIGTAQYTLVVDSCLNNINPLSIHNGIGIYPNPTDRYLTIEMITSSGEADYRLVNSIGQEVKAGRLDLAANKIDLGELAPGIYSIVVKQKDKINIAKIILQR